ncbi:biotin--[acetyl-CoA-carboxylase] ligase [Parabacteroides sp. AM08-6]|uniref:biotin--[acetyl-CoA-carboxylase] ligase n=1 Tax=Parabacteroides sp. AM08-6 TaxID=2292053 RepID=UPI000F00B14B|nr:biotin--[acetyl-CoA-carboxylase] ligase [Parabacteroides sp. AM08-6]RHJ82463.1 biotin--[acetyl-CoA-carboxylase] ligase [Parabacteroides sp. AM08-6]
MKSEHDIPRIIRVEETTSTNNYLRELSSREALAEGSLVVADFQTSGKGQVGNTWESEAGKNLMFSLLLYPDFLPANRQFLVSQIAALSVKETLEMYVDCVAVKWPNDIYRKDKKICGMLIENDLSGSYLYSSVIGIGINVNQQVFRSDAPNPVSLAQITGKEYDREEILQRFLRIFFNYYSLLLQEKQSEIRTAYMATLFRNEGFWPYKDEKGPFCARIHAIEPTGHLILELPEGELRRYAFKEVSAVIN